MALNQITEKPVATNETKTNTPVETESFIRVRRAHVIMKNIQMLPNLKVWQSPSVENMKFCVSTSTNLNTSRFNSSQLTKCTSPTRKKQASIHNTLRNTKMLPKTTPVNALITLESCLRSNFTVHTYQQFQA